MSCSTSSADRPSASVWTSTVTGANSGNTSVSARRRVQTPNTMITTAMATTARRALRLVPTIQRIIGGNLPASGGRCRAARAPCLRADLRAVGLRRPWKRTRTSGDEVFGRMNSGRSGCWTARARTTSARKAQERRARSDRNAASDRPATRPGHLQCGARPFSKASGPSRHDSPTIWTTRARHVEPRYVDRAGDRCDPRTRSHGRSCEGGANVGGRVGIGVTVAMATRTAPSTVICRARGHRCWMGARGKGSLRTETWPSGDTRERAALRRRISACS